MQSWAAWNLAMGMGRAGRVRPGPVSLSSLPSSCPSKKCHVLLHLPCSSPSLTQPGTLNPPCSWSRLCLADAHSLISYQFDEGLWPSSFLSLDLSLLICKMRTLTTQLPSDAPRTFLGTMGTVPLRSSQALDSSLKLSL